MQHHPRKPHIPQTRQKCDSLAGLEAVRLNQPFIYLCHCGIVDVAVPITVGDQYLGAVMFGQVRISNGSDAGVERLVNEISSFHTDNVVSALHPICASCTSVCRRWSMSAYAASRK